MSETGSTRPREPDTSTSAISEAEGRRIDLWWAATMVVLLGSLFAVLSLFKGVAVPLLLSLAFAYVSNPLVSKLEKRRLSRTVGTTIVFAGVVVLGVGAALYLIPVFRAEALKLPDFFRDASARFVPWVEETFGVALPELVRARTEEIGYDASNLLRDAGPAAAKIAAAFAGNTARVLAMVLGLLVVPVLSFFFLKDYPVILAFFEGLIPRRAASLVSKRFREVDEVLSAFATGQLMVGAILAVIYSLGLSIARVDLAIVIGCIAGFGNMVPYVGTGVGVLLAVLGLALSWLGFWQVGVVAGTFVGAQLLEGLVITPRIVGSKVGLPPVAVIVAVLAFGELFGFVGVLLAVPSSAVLKVVFRVVVERYRRSPVYGVEGS